MHDRQTTLKSRVTLSGAGVHSGKQATVHCIPADSDTGIIFQTPAGTEIRAVSTEVGSTELCTVLGDPSACHVATVEHLMAAVFGLGIDNMIVEMEGAEVPILDGSAEAFVEAFDEVGITQLAARRRYIRVLEPVRIENGSSWAEFVPYDGTRFEIEIDYDNPGIGRQAFRADIDPIVFRKEIARARTFGFMRDVERLWAAGFALGSSLENSLVVDEDGSVINLDGLRYSDEFARHKTLDAMGDLALAGARFIGCFRSYRGGHKLNAAALRRLLSRPTAFEIVEATRRERGRTAELITVNAPAYAPWVL